MYLCMFQLIFEAHGRSEQLPQQSWFVLLGSQHHAQYMQMNFEELI